MEALYSALKSTETHRWAFRKVSEVWLKLGQQSRPRISSLQAGVGSVGSSRAQCWTQHLKKRKRRVKKRREGRAEGYISLWKLLPWDFLENAPLVL